MPTKVKVLQELESDKPSRDNLRCLLECMLTVTIQAHLTESKKLIVASLKLNDDLRRASTASCDSFYTWTLKLCAIASLREKSAAKMLEALHEGLKKCGYDEVTFTCNGVKVDKNLMQSCQAVLRNMTPESEDLLQRGLARK